MGSTTSCMYCGSDGTDYNNPLFTLHHIGKYNEKVICAYCWEVKRHKKNTNIDLLTYDMDELDDETEWIR